MKNNMKILVGILGLLLVLNIVKWAGSLSAGRDNDSSILNPARFSLNIQQAGEAAHAKALRNLFNAQSDDYASQQPRNNTAIQQVQAEKKWPGFRISGTAVNEGKKCAFFSGPDFKGMVYENNEIMDFYVLSGVSDNQVEITDTNTNQKKTYRLEAK